MSKHNKQKANNLHFLCVIHKVRTKVFFSFNFQLLMFCVFFFFFPENIHVWQHGIDKLSGIF